MVIAVPTGIKIWATVRVYAELLPSQANSKVEFTEGLSAYSDTAMLGGPQPALKGIMRTQADAMNNCWSKIDFEAIRCLRMRLNYQNSSNFGSHHAYLWFQLLHRYLGPLKVKIYFEGISKTKTLLIAFRTGYKRVSLFIKSGVAYATGEVSFTYNNRKGDGRGSVVPILQIGKGPKHFAKLGTLPNQTRSYVTRSGMKSLAPVRLLSPIPAESCLNSWFVTGFTDAEGSFIVGITKNSELRHGIRIRASFQIQLHERDLDLLKLIQKYFQGIGSITKGSEECLIFRVSSREDILKYVIPHFDKYPLITQKKEDFELFKSILAKLNNREHLTSDGIQEIVNIRSSLNLGLPEDLRLNFPNTVPVPRRVVDGKIPDPD